MAVHNPLYMCDPERTQVDDDVITPSPDQGLAELGDFLSRAIMAARATSGYQAACRRSECPAASAILYDDEEETAIQCAETDVHESKN